MKLRGDIWPQHCVCIHSIPHAYMYVSVPMARPMQTDHAYHDHVDEALWYDTHVHNLKINTNKSCTMPDL